MTGYLRLDTSAAPQGTLRQADGVSMKTLLSALVLATVGCSSAGSNNGSSTVSLPKVYPPVRASTPAGLIADSKYAPPNRGSRVTPLETGAAGLATVVQERLYTPGPTEILRILQDLDDRTASLDTRADAHPCLTSTPIAQTYALPGGQTFSVKLQCIDQLGSKGRGLDGGSGQGGQGWLAFGFGTALAAPLDGGVSDLDGGIPDGGSLDGGGADGGGADGGGIGAVTGGGNDFYLVEGQAGGMGGLYHLDRTSGNVEAWIAVADSVAINNSQVMMHLSTDKAAGTLEIALGGSAVGFCEAHLKMSANTLFINAKTNAPPPPGTTQQPGTQSCDAARAGCFDTAALATDLGGDSPRCAAIAQGSFAILTELDASADPGANVDPQKIYTYLAQPPVGVPAF